MESPASTARSTTVTSAHAVQWTLLAVFVAFLTSLLSVFLQKSVRDGGLTRYAVNFGYDVCASIFALALCFWYKTGSGLKSWKPLLANALCSWMYQWGSVHALETLPLAVVAGVNSSLNPLFGVFFSSIFLSEKATCWFVVVLLRNIAAVWLMLAPMFVAVHGSTGSATSTTQQAHDQSSRITGILFAVLIALSVAAGLTLQRSLKGEHPVLIVMWSYAVNAVLWTPPGVSAKVRVPFLWPPTANDGHELGSLCWVWVVLAGIAGVLACTLIAKCLANMDLPTFTIIFGPTMIAGNCVLDFALGNPIAKLTFLGVILVVTSLAVDTVLGKKMSSSGSSSSSSYNDSSADDEERTSLLQQPQRSSSPPT